MPYDDFEAQIDGQAQHQRCQGAIIKASTMPLLAYGMHVKDETRQLQILLCKPVSCYFTTLPLSLALTYNFDTFSP
jgi:hypothetical protein